MKNKSVSRMAIISMVLLCMTSCRMRSGSGDIVTETRTTVSFTGVEVGGNFDVEIKKGDKTEVIIEADDNLIKHIESGVVNGTLRIRSTDHNLRNAHFKAYITAPEIDHINASASASIEVKGGLTSERSIKLDVSSAADITAVINSPEVIAGASSGGELHLSGRTRNFVSTTSSGAEIDAINLLSENTRVSSSSGANARVYASVSLEATASSGGDIRYKGNASVKKSTSSGADIEKED